MSSNEIEDYELIPQDEFVLGDRLANNWIEQIKPDKLSKYDRIYIAKVDKHLEIGYMKAEFLR